MAGHDGTLAPRARFAPSPTGPLHFGSLVAAVGSFADARAARGAWLVRIEDLDQTREVRGAADDILRTLDRFGLHWDETVVYQSRRTEAYALALCRLRERGFTFPCACSRREIAALGRLGPEGPIYPGTCRHGIPHSRKARSERLRVTEIRPYIQPDIQPGIQPGIQIAIKDRIHGPITQNLAEDIGDFVLRRADGLHAYQLAVVVDDAAQGIDSIVRGADLLLSTPRQAYLQRLLDLPRPSYAHLPLVVDDAGRKLSKSLAAAPVNPADPLPALTRAWHLLGQAPMPDAPRSVTEFWQWAAIHWRIERVPRGQIAPDQAS